MRTDNTVKLLQAIMPGIVATVLVVGGLVMLYDLIVRGLLSPDAGLAIIGPSIGAAVAYVFQQKTVTDTANAVTNGVITTAVHAARDERPPAH